MGFWESAKTVGKWIHKTLLDYQSDYDSSYSETQRWCRNFDEDRLKKEYDSIRSYSGSRMMGRKKAISDELEKYK